MDKKRINSAQWVQQGKNIGINLKDILFQDKKRMYSALDRLGLPRVKTLFYPGAEYNKHNRTIKKFIEERNPVFSRLNPIKRNLHKRPYKIDIYSLEDLTEFIETSKVNLSDYELHLVQNGKVKYSGIIIHDSRLVAELSKGHSLALVQGWITPLNVQFDEFRRRFVFKSDKDYSQLEKKLLLQAIRMIRMHKGYFEFHVIDNNVILFKNYQDKGGLTRI